MLKPQVLQIKLLGGFDLSYGDTSLTGTLPESLQLLLAYLVLHRRSAQARQQLAFLFWPGSTDSQARTNLRRLIYDLRRVLPDVEQFMMIDSKSLQWRIDSSFRLDVIEFEQAIADAEAAEQIADSAAVRNALERAANLYPGKLLPNCYEEWIEPEQDRLHQACIRVYTWLVQTLQAQQDYGDAVRYAQQLLRLDPLNEVAYAQLMRSCALNGDRANALQVYHRCLTVLRDELGVHPSAATRTLYEQLLHATHSESLVAEETIEQQDGGETLALLTEQETIPSPAPAPLLRCDWGEAPDANLFYGRTEELSTLQHWINRDRCKVIALVGMGGVGKTALSVKAAQQLTNQRTESKSQNEQSCSSSFQFVIWRSLRNAPPLKTLLTELVPFLSEQNETEATLDQLIHGLRASRCLLILDNMETILQGEQQSGQYLSGYEEYGELLRLLGETAHQSCLILTSREKPAEIAVLEGEDLPVKSLLLSGSPEASLALIQAKGLVGSQQEQQQLSRFYGNNPLALKIVATSIQDLFDGNISDFLSQNVIIFNSIHRLIDQQCQRCMPLEKTIMYWLAINQEWTSISELAEDIVPNVSRAELLEALASLRWRTLLEKQSGRYTQQPVVMQYFIHQLIEAITAELLTGTLSLFINHALLKSTAKDDVKESQRRLLLEPIANQLVNRLGQAQAVEQLKAIHYQLKTLPSSGYGATNLIHLLFTLNVDSTVITSDQP